MRYLKRRIQHKLEPTCYLSSTKVLGAICVIAETCSTNLRDWYSENSPGSSDWSRGHFCSHNYEKLVWPSDFLNLGQGQTSKYILPNVIIIKVQLFFSLFTLPFISTLGTFER